MYNGPNQTYPLLGTYCGQTIPSPVRATGYQMMVHFQSDSSVAYGGFRATFNTDSCGDVVLATED